MEALLAGFVLGTADLAAGVLAYRSQRAQGRPAVSRSSTGRVSWGLRVPAAPNLTWFCVSRLSPSLTSGWACVLVDTHTRPALLPRKTPELWTVQEPVE